MILSTDSTANLPKEFYKKYNIKMIPMQINLNDVTYNDLSVDLPVEEYYQKMREGAAPTTAQINEYNAKLYFEELLKEGEDIIHIGFSSALSGSTITLKRVADELNQINKNKIYIVDSLNASCGEGLLVLKAREFIDAGKSIEEVKAEVEKLIPYTCSYFTVEQLKYLVRGGRVGKFSGIVGTLLNIKPVLRVNEEGKLVSYKKIITRKKSIAEMANIVTEKIADKTNVLIAHAVCEQDAKDFAKSLNETLGINPIITDLTQVIGCHTGPGLLAVFFIGKEK
ncbi:MAG: DegV family protein [Clostridia bacterium]|nr:DegV family protein [Clostridia bacterium]